MSDEINELTVKLTADVRSFEAAMGSAVGGVTKSLGKVALAAAGAAAAFALVNVAADALVDATVKAADFEQAIVNAASKTDNFIAAQVRFEDAAIKAGLATAFSAQQTADALNILATAGFGIQDATESLPGVLQLAQAAMLSLSEAASITAGTMKGYGFGASDLGRINDVLVSGFTGANQTASELGISLRKAAPMAKLLGQEFETTVTILSIMNNANIEAETSGTALRVGMARLAEPTKKVAARLQELQVKTRASGGKLLDMIDIMADLGKAHANAGDLAVIFGQKAGPTLATLLVAGEDATRKFQKRLLEAGGTAETMEKRQLATLGSQMKILTGTLETAAIAFGSILGPAIKPVITAFQKQAQAALQSGSGLEAFKRAVVSTAEFTLTFLEIVEALIPPFLAWMAAVRVIVNVQQILMKTIVAAGRVVLGFVTVAIGGFIEGVGSLIDLTAQAANAVGLDFGAALASAGQDVVALGKEVTDLGMVSFASLDDIVTSVSEDFGDMDDAVNGFGKRSDDATSKVALLRGALQEGKKAVEGISNGALLGAIALAKFGDGAEEAKNKFRDFKKEVGGLEKLLIEIEPTVRDTGLKGLEKGFKLKKKIEVDFADALKDLEPTFKDTDLLPETQKAMDEVEAEAKAMRNRLIATGFNITSTISGIFGDTAKRATDFAISVGQAFLAGGPVVAGLAVAEGLASALAEGVTSLIDMAKETEGFAQASQSATIALQNVGLPDFDNVMGEFMAELAPIAEIFATVTQALGPIGGFGGIFEGLGESIFGGVKSFVLVVLELSIAYQDASAVVLQVAADLVGFMARTLKAIEKMLFLDPSDLRKALNKMTKDLQGQADAARGASEALNRAKTELEALTIEAVRAKQAIFGATIDPLFDLLPPTLSLSDAMNKLNSEIGEALTNVPTGVKVALRRFQATEAEDGSSLMGDSSAARLPGSGSIGTVPIIIQGDLVITATTDEQAGTILDTIRSVTSWQKMANNGSVPVGVSPYLGRAIQE